MFDEVQFTLKNREIEYDQWSDWQKVGRQLIAIFYSISVTHSTWNNVIFLITSHSAKVLVHRFTAVGGFAIMIMKYCQYIFHPLHGLFIQSIYECERIGVCVCEYWKQIRPEKKKRWIFEAEKASSIPYCAFIYLFFSVFNAFDLWLKCLFFSLLLIWYRCSREILFAALVHCGIVFYVCNVHVTMTMWILDSILLLFLLVIDAVANDTLQNTCEHGNNHAFNFKFAHMHACMHAPTCMIRANQILIVRCQQGEFNLFASL